MGYNRSGKRRTDRLKRHKKLMKRLLAREAGQEKPKPAAAKTPAPSK
jgi:hypothetical protein